MEILEDEIPPKLSSYGIIRGSTWRVAKSSPIPTIPPPSQSPSDSDSNIPTPPPPQPATPTHDVEISEKNTKKLKHVYEELLFGHTDEITLLFHRDEPDVKRKMCIDLIKACPSSYKFTDPVLPPTNADLSEQASDEQQAQPVGEDSQISTPTKDEL